jgi:hypothetical protein
MIRDRKYSQFLELKDVYPDAKLTNDRKFVLVPEVLLPSKFNRKSTPVLISLTEQYLLFGFPAVYVSRNLRIRKSWNDSFQKSRHLDEILTEEEMLRNGWVKLCWYNPPKVKNLTQLMANVIVFLEGLNE